MTTVCLPRASDWRPFALLTVTCLYLASGSLLAEDLWEDVSLAPQRQLCVIGNQVVTLDSEECRYQQALERRNETLVNRTLNEFSVETGSPVFSLDLLEGIALGAQYKYLVEPSYRDQFFSRVDRYTVSTAIKPGDWFETLPVLVGIDAGAEILFAQQFASGTEARDLGNTYLPNRLPLTADKALALKPGDYVRFDAHLSLLTKLGQLYSLPQRLLSAQASVSAIASGEFQVHVFRLDAGRVRLKLVAERERTLEAGAAVRPNVPLAILGLNARSQQIVEFAKFDRALKLAIGKSNQSLFAVDYTLDLSAPEVRSAYDRVFSSRQTLTAATIGDPATDHFSLRHRLVGSLTELDDLAIAGDPNAAPLAVRNFKGSAYAGSRQINLSVSLRSYDVKRERIYREKFLTKATRSDDGSEHREHYLMPSWSRVRERTAFLGKLSEATVYSADAIFSANEKGEPVGFQNIGFSFAYDDSLIRPTEYRRLREKIELLLPADGQKALAELLSDTLWLEQDNHRQVKIDLNYFFRKEALSGLVDTGFGQRKRLESEIVDFVVAAIKDGDFPYYYGTLDAFVDDYRSVVSARGSERRDPELYAKRVVRTVWGTEIRRVARHLETALTETKSNKRRMDAFVDLRWSPFYRSIGNALWIHLVNRAELNLADVLYLELSLQGQDRQSIHFAYGNSEERELYDAVRFVENVLNNRETDMREDADIDSIISRMTIVEPGV